MTRPKVYVTRRIPEAGLAPLAASCELTVNPEDRALTRRELLDNVAEADGVLGLPTDRIDAAFFDAATRLKGYANYAVGFDNIDVPEATRRGLPVSNTPDVLTRATAEMAWTLLFAAARRLIEASDVLRSGAWTGIGPMQFLGSEVSGATLGVAGAGRIGAAMALMSKGFGMRVLYTTGGGRKNELLERELDARLVSFDELLAESDFLSAHLPLTPATRHVFDAAAFRKMKKTAYFINTGRGQTVDEAALVAALASGEIAGAGLDVYEFEPKTAEGLLDLKNVVAAPHIGSATRTAREGMARKAAENLLAMLFGKRPPNCLNPEVLKGA